jgi:GNAT superfamily N-acetyltransferase
MIKIFPLSKKHLEEAVSLVEAIFSYKEDQKIARINLIESLSQRNFEKSYWVVKNKTGEIVGLTGLYKDHEDETTVWLGWFGVHPSSRRQGIGSFLLGYTIKEAKWKGFAKLKIYTSTDKSERAAHKIYELYGFNKLKVCRQNESIYYIRHL